MHNLHFAAAPYSNSAPLVDFIKQQDVNIKITHGPPSSHINELLSGKVDCALIPVVHLFENPILRYFNNLGVAANGPVRSVLLKCNKPIDELAIVNKDPSSATSNMLAQIILQHYFNQPVEMCNNAIAPDGEVIIGDKALFSEKSKYKDVDLADYWKKLTGLPFVFAVWAVRKDNKYANHIEKIITNSAEVGMKSIPSIAKRYSKEIGNTQSFWEEYLTTNIHFRFNEKDLKGLELFREMLCVNKILSSYVDA